jgi:hypothetical protein
MEQPSIHIGLDHWSSGAWPEAGRRRRGVGRAMRRGSGGACPPPDPAPDGPFLTRPGLQGPCTRANAEQTCGQNGRVKNDLPGMFTRANEEGPSWSMSATCRAITVRITGQRRTVCWRRSGISSESIRSTAVASQSSVPGRGHCLGPARGMRTSAMGWTIAARYRSCVRGLGARCSEWHARRRGSCRLLSARPSRGSSRRGRDLEPQWPESHANVKPGRRAEEFCSPPWAGRGRPMARRVGRQPVPAWARHRQGRRYAS